jgi:hypothetical protein
MTNIEIANSISHKLFADRPTIAEAWNDAFDMINRMADSEKVTATTAMMIMLNTVANEIRKNEVK